MYNTSALNSLNSWKYGALNLLFSASWEWSGGQVRTQNQCEIIQNGLKHECLKLLPFPHPDFEFNFYKSIAYLHFL